MVVFSQPDVLRACEGGDFNHKNSYEEPHFNYTKNCHTKHGTATFASPLLADALRPPIVSRCYLSI